MGGMRLLVLDDEADVREGVAERLCREGHTVVRCGAIAEVDDALAAGDFDVFVLDRQLPDGDVVEALPRWCANGLTARVLLLTASASVADRVGGLGAGADDYLTKPFALAELIARVEALGRRPAVPPLVEITVGSLRVSLSERRVYRAEIELPLRPKEFAVLEALARATPRPVSRERLRASVWEDGLGPRSNADEVAIASLRRKLGEPGLIETVRGLGWALREPGV